jgi:MraZ protein
MFIGEYTISMDAKGRVAVPAKFRPNLGSTIVITKGVDNCLFLYTKDEWEKIALKYSALPISKSDSRAFTRLMLGGAYDCEVDRQGRVIIPEDLRKFASLTKKVVTVGLYSRVEIWDEQTWTDYKKSTEKDTAKITEELGELGV